MSNPPRSLKAFNPYRDPNYKMPGSEVPVLQVEKTNIQTNIQPINKEEENLVLIASLVSMGFKENSIKLALSSMTNPDIDSVIAWIFQHPEQEEEVGDVEIPEATDSPAVVENLPAKKLPKGAPLGWKPNETFDDGGVETFSQKLAREKEEKRLAAESIAAAKAKDGKVTAADKIAAVKDIKTATSNASKLEAEKRRRDNAKLTLETKRQREELERQKALDRARREREREKARLKKIKDEIRADKERRRKEREDAQKK